jgi:hypothetical protein
MFQCSQFHLKRIKERWIGTARCSASLHRAARIAMGAAVRISLAVVM